MGKIRFRFYDKEFEQMVLPDSGYDNYDLLTMNGKPVQANDYGVNPFNAEVMLSVGINDKNGVEIFEGDIVTNEKQTFVVEMGEQTIEGDSGEEIIYYGFNILLGAGYPNAVKNEYEVIGNVYQKSETIESNENE